MFEFSIHGNSQRLKHAGRGLLASVLLKPSRYCGLNGLNEIAGRFEWRTPPPLDDRRRNLPTESFFSVFAKDRFERLGIRLIDEVSDGLAGTNVEAHIKRCVDRVPEASLRICELIGRKS